MPTRSEVLRQVTEKLLMRREIRGAVCRVFPPAGGARGYTVIVEISGIREQFFVQASHVEQFATSGNEQNVLPEVRAGVRNVERMVIKKRASRSR